MLKIINTVVVRVTTPEIYPAIVHMTLPHAPLMDAVQYELEEYVRRSSFQRRYGMTIDAALSGNDK